MEGVDYIALAIPVFFALIGVELLIARWQKKKLYRLNDSLNDLECGVLSQVLGVFTKTVVFGIYVALFEAVHLLPISSSSAWAWAVCFLGVDFCYYWFHRISHESNLPWGAHIVHHSSEEYNLAVALRQGAFQPLFGWIFYLPLAWIGFPPLMFLACKSFNTLYQFWIHTRTIGKLGPFEWVFNTPSHHRVHHGCDAKYIDKNYAGTLIVFDRLFGSFQEEEEEPTYGITKPLADWNPVWANFHYWNDLVALSRRAPSWRERLKVWLKPPAWKPDWAPEGPRDSRGRTPLTHGEAGKYDARAPFGLSTYAFVQFLSLIGLTLFLLGQQGSLAVAVKAGLALLITWTAANAGSIFDGKRWVLISELTRLAVTALAAIALAAGQGTATVAATATAAALGFGLFAAWLLRYRTFFLMSPAAAAE
jgi:sterol desaturase/sphingolipid hydroxylase (fatty acid hydroxylase superfamily)